MDLTSRLNTIFAPREPYRIVRPDIPHTVHHVSWWLRRHHEGGWMQGPPENPERDQHAACLLFVVWRLFARHPDVLTDERAELRALDAMSAERRAGL